MTHPEIEVSSKEIQALRSEFGKALFGPPDLLAPFKAIPPDQGVEPSKYILERKEELERWTGRFFGILERLTVPGAEVRVPRKYLDSNEEEGTTFSRAALEFGRESESGKPREQIWIAELGLIETRDRSQLTKRLEAQRNSALEKFVRTARKDTAKAAEIKESILEQIIGLSLRPIEKTDIVYQLVSARTVFQPMIGVRVIRYLDGYQAYPVIYEGKKPAVLTLQPILSPTTPLTVDELGETLPFGLVSKDAFQTTSLNRLKERLFSIAGFNQ